MNVQYPTVVIGVLRVKSEPPLKRGSIYRIYSALRRGFPRSRMSTNYQISPVQFCCNTRFTLPKQPQRSRSVLKEFWDCFGSKKNTVL